MSRLDVEARRHGYDVPVRDVRDRNAGAEVPDVLGEERDAFEVFSRGHGEDVDAGGVEELAFPGYEDADFNLLG